MEDKFPPYVQYWITASSKNDCFFIVGPKSGPTERIGSFKLFLEAHSEPLRRMLDESDLAEKGDIHITDVEPTTFRNFIKCVYGGSDIVIKKLSFDESAQLLYVAEKYLVTEIKEKIVAHMIHLLPQTINNVFVALSNPVCFQIDTLDKIISAIIQHDTDKIFADKLFLQLEDEALELIVKQETLNTSESSIWEAVLKWANHKVISSEEKVSRRSMLKKTLKHIRFCAMSPREFLEKVYSTDILTLNELHEISKSFGTKQPPNIMGLCNNRNQRYGIIEESHISEITISHFAVPHNMTESENVYSRPFHLGKYCWNIVLQKKQNKLGIYLLFNSNSRLNAGLSWSASITAELHLINQNGKPNISRLMNYNTFVTREGYLIGYSSLCDWDTVVSNTAGFLKNDKILVKAHIFEKGSS